MAALEAGMVLLEVGKRMVLKEELKWEFGDLLWLLELRFQF
jgi:hypothetical protein